MIDFFNFVFKFDEQAFEFSLYCLWYVIYHFRPAVAHSHFKFLTLGFLYLVFISSIIDPQTEFFSL